MKNATHRVIILKNCNSALISQAIFFLKDSGDESESKILSEAEKIVQKYMQQEGSDCSICTSKKHSENRLVKFASIGIGILAIVGVIIALI